MASNIKPVDRLIRIVIGLGILSLVFTHRTWLGLFGFYPLVTAFFGYSPFYAWLKRRNAQT